MSDCGADAPNRLVDAPRKVDASRDRLSVLAEQQAALRRVATLVARGGAAAEVFEAVTDELVHWLHMGNAGMLRYEGDGTATLLASRSEPGTDSLPIGMRVTLEGDNIPATVLKTGLPARQDSLEDTASSFNESIRELGIQSAIGVPIIIDGRVWGAIGTASSRPEPLPPDTEMLIGDFADLVATAIANTATRDQLRELAEHQAAVRRVATLVARGVSPSEVFAAVAKEIGELLNITGAGVSRYADDAIAVVGQAVPAEVQGNKDWVPLRVSFPLEGDNVATRVLRTKSAARMDSHDDDTGPVADVMRQLGVQSMVAVPILVGDRVWGLACGGTVGDEPMPADTEERLADFADLVATAIANAATRDELQASRDSSQALAEQQAALRRVATLVARGASPSEVFQAVAEDAARCLNASNASVSRIEGDTMTFLALANPDPGIAHQPVVGERLTIEGDSPAVEVLRTGRAARADYPKNDSGAVADRIREMGLHSVVGAPIIVEGRIWGILGVGSSKEPLPADTEERLGDFADLVSTAVANAATRDELIATRDELIASRARIVAAADDGRRRIERDLHDGAQQQLVSLGLQLRLAESSVPPELRSLKDLVSGVVSGLTAVSSELQEISRGIHPAILSDGGLGPALKTLARRCPILANVDVRVERRLPDSVEVAAYYVVAEALTNAAKYANASEVSVCAEVKDGHLCLSIQDDGIGGADSCKGSGLIGLNDRVEVLGGQMTVSSPPGSGTTLHVTIPLHG